MLAPDSLIQNRYRIIRSIGQGGMGAVYEALDQRLSAVVALKETFVSEEPHRRAFEREAHLLANLRHPALPKVIDFFIQAQAQYLVMEYIPGRDLARLLTERGAPFPSADVLAWAEPILRALEYLHSHEPPILHRDIKPANIKLTDDGDIYLLDFGIAKGATGGMMQTQTSVFAFTPQYAPPEQIIDEPTDPRSDLYSLAATLYHLLTGSQMPDTMTRVMRVIAGQAPDPLQAVHMLNPEVPPAVGEVVMRALALSKEERFASANEMLRALREAGRDVTVRAPPLPLGARPAAVAEPPTERSLPAAARLEEDTRTPGAAPYPETVIRDEEDESSSPPPGADAPLPPPEAERTVVLDGRTVHMRPGERPPEGKAPPPEFQTVLVKHSELFRHDDEHLFEDLILHKDYERLWRLLIHAGGGRNLLTGYGPFGGTSLIRCAIAKARSELERAEKEAAALLALYFQITEESADGFEIEVVNVGFSHTRGAESYDANSDIRELKARAGKEAGEVYNTVLNFPLDERRGGDFFDPPTVMPAAGALGPAYDFTEFVADLNSFFKQKKRDKALQQIVMRLAKSRDIPSRVIFIIDRVRRLETLEALARSEMFNNKRIRVIAVARKEDFDGWERAHRRLREIDFSKWYVPSLWDIDWRRSLFDGASASAPGTEQHYDLFIRHLQFRGRGSLGYIIRELKRPMNMHFGSDASYLDVVNLTARSEVQHNGWLQRVLDLNWDTILGDFFGGVNQDERTDRARVGVYFLLDWLAHKNSFTRDELLREAGCSRVTIADDETARAGAIDNLLHVFVRNRYLLASGDSYRVVWNKGRQPRPVRVRPRRPGAWTWPWRRPEPDADARAATADAPGPDAPAPHTSAHDRADDERLTDILELPPDVLELPPNFRKLPFPPAHEAGFPAAPPPAEPAARTPPAAPPTHGVRQPTEPHPATGKPAASRKVFISYSRNDEEWLRRLHVHLKPLEREGVVELWDDTNIRAGDNWREEIRGAISSSRIAILLVSASSLASDFIMKNELLPLLDASARAGMLLIPIIVSPCQFSQSRLAHLHTANDPRRPLSSMSWHEQEALFVEVADNVLKALGA